MRKISPATILAVIAIVVASAGTATAVTLVTGKQVKNGSLTGKDVRNRSLTGRDIKAGSIGATQLAAGLGGQPGAAGPKGDKGDAGPNGTPDPSAFYDKAASDERFQARYRTTHVVRGDGTPVENGQRLLDVLTEVPAGESVDDARLVLLEPGRFEIGEEHLVMKRYVDLAGSGAGVTRISGTSDEDVVVGASDATLRDVAVVNAGGGSFVVALRSAGSDFRVQDADVRVLGDNNTAAAVMVNNGDITLRDTRVRAEAGDTAYGIDSIGTVSVIGSEVVADVTQFQNYALYAAGGTITVRDSRLVAPDAVFEGAASAFEGTIRIATSELDSPTTTASGVTCVYAWRGTTALNGSCG